ncbi:hypothetical protein TYRP_013373 [Tyrophagus putrescentiae]|nr:hypothetical protein TYRP_013373 [Tyrophagus putrescentiae]
MTSQGDAAAAATVHCSGGSASKSAANSISSNDSSQQPRRAGDRAGVGEKIDREETAAAHNSVVIRFGPSDPCVPSVPGGGGGGGGLVV